MTKTQQLQSNYIDQAIDFSVITFARYEKFDLNSILKEIAFWPISLYVVITMIWDYFTSTSMILDVKVLKPIVHPTLFINEDLQKMTVKNLRQLRSFPKSYKKQDMINALLTTH